MAKRQLRPAPRSIRLAFGMEMKGSCELKCREAATGELVWEDQVDNVITDLGRRLWFDDMFNNPRIATNPSTEQPDYRRYTVAGTVDSNLSPTSAPIAFSWNGSTMTKTWTTTFGTPSATRTIGTVALCSIGYLANVGFNGMYSYLLLTPPKTQSTTQTLELVYKVVLSPIA